MPLASRSPPARPGEEPPARQSLRSHRSFPLRQENQIKRILPRFPQVPGAPHPFRDAARAIPGRIPPAERGHGRYWDGRRMQRALKIHLTSYLVANSRPVSSRLCKRLMPGKLRGCEDTLGRAEFNWEPPRNMRETGTARGWGQSLKVDEEIWSRGRRKSAPGAGTVPRDGGFGRENSKKKS